MAITRYFQLAINKEAYSQLICTKKYSKKYFMVREKYRYIVLRIDPPIKISERDFHIAVESVARECLSDWEYACSIPRLRIVEYYPYNSFLIIKVQHCGKDAFYNVLQKITQVDGYTCSLSSLICTGAIRKAKTWILTHKFS